MRPSSKSGSNPATPNRPSSTLEINGSTPPSRQGTQATRTGTGMRTGTGKLSDSPLGALATKMILKMRMRFGDAASDLKAQEIITNEVMSFMAKAGSVKEEDINVLETRIRAKLTGATPPSHTMSAAKKAAQEGDEWAKIYEYSISKGKVLDERAAVMHRQQQLQTRETLKGQMAELEMRKKAEHDDEVAYFHSEQASLREWEQQEEARRKLQHDIMEKLKQERSEQLTEKEQRRQNARNKVQQEESRTAAKMAYQTRAEFEREETERATAKAALKDFLFMNEENKKIKEHDKKKQWEEDQTFKKQWEEILNKQERDRTMHVDRLKARQDVQAEVAKTRPEAKRWIDQSIIDKHYKEREDARAAEEDRRQTLVRDTGRRIAQTLAEQIEERERLKAQQRADDEAKGRMVVERAAAEERREQEKKAKAMEKRWQGRLDLEAQMRANVLRKQVIPMAVTERKINSELLEKVQDFRLTGRVNV